MYRYSKTIESAIVTWIKSVLQYRYVFSEKQKLKATIPAGEPFATYDLGASVKTGYDDMNFVDGVYVYSGRRKLPLSVTIYGDNALEDASILRNSLEKETVLGSLRMEGIFISKAFGIMDTSAFLETGFQTRGTLDIEFYVTETYSDDTGWIETVELSQGG